MPRIWNRKDKKSTASGGTTPSTDSPQADPESLGQPTGPTTTAPTPGPSHEEEDVQTTYSSMGTKRGGTQLENAVAKRSRLEKQLQEADEKLKKAEEKLERAETDLEQAKKKLSERDDHVQYLMGSSDEKQRSDYNNQLENANKALDRAERYHDEAKKERDEAKTERNEAKNARKEVEERLLAAEAEEEEEARELERLQTSFRAAEEEFKLDRNNNKYLDNLVEAAYNLRIFLLNENRRTIEEQLKIAENKSKEAKDDKEKAKWDKELEARFADLNFLIGDKTVIMKALRLKIKMESLPTEITLELLDEIANGIEIVPRLSAYDPKVQERLLKRFYKDGCKIPVIDNGLIEVLDMTLMECLSGSDRRPATEALIESFNTKMYHAMIAVSGAGKTSCYTDLAKDHLIVYVQCTPRSDKSELRRSLTHDKGFVASLEAFFEAEMMDKNRNLNEASRIFTIDLLCRFLELRRLLAINPKMTPLEFLIHQKSSNDIWTSKIRQEVQNLSMDCCKRLIEAIRNDLERMIKEGAVKRVVVVIDEVECAAAEFVGSFDPDYKAFLHPMIHALSSLENAGRFHVVFSGTGSTLNRVESIRSSLQKDDALNIVSCKESTFPTITPFAIQKLFSQLEISRNVLDTNKIKAAKFVFRKVQNFEDIIDSLNLFNLFCFFVVGSRFRMLSRIVRNIARYVEKQPELNEEMILLKAVRNAVKSLHKGLLETFEKYAGVRAINLFNGEQSSVDKYNEYLASVWSANLFFGGEARFLYSKAGLDLTKLGIGNYIYEMEDDTHYVVSESVVIASIQTYLQKNGKRVLGAEFSISLTTMARLLEKHGNIPARGNIFERIVFDALTNQEFQGKLVSELPFVKPFEAKRFRMECERNETILKTRQDLEAGRMRWTRNAQAIAESKVTTLAPWWNTAKFAVDAVVRRDEVEESTSSYLAKTKNVLYVPETTARFDAAIMLDDNKHAMTFAVTMWNDSVPHDKVMSQLLSTDMNLAYYKVDGIEVNPSCTEQRNEWESKNLHNVRSVRVCITLPTTTSVISPKDVDASSPLKFRDDELMVHLDHTNIHHLLGPNQEDMYRLFAIATKTDPSQWGPKQTTT